MALIVISENSSSVQNNIYNKNIAISEIYIIYMDHDIEKRLKQGGHTLNQPRIKAFFRYTYMSFLLLTKKVIKAQNRHNFKRDICF